MVMVPPERPQTNLEYLYQVIFSEPEWNVGDMQSLRLVAGGDTGQGARGCG